MAADGETTAVMALASEAAAALTLEPEETAVLAPGETTAVAAAAQEAETAAP